MELEPNNQLVIIVFSMLKINFGLKNFPETGNWYIHATLSLRHFFQTPFLALLDYVSRAHEIEICLSSIRPSIRRPSVALIISEATAWIAFKFQLWLLLGYMPRCFFHFLKKNFFLIF